MHRTQGEDYIEEGGLRRYRPATPPSIPATRYPAESANAVQEEICNVIEKSGIAVAADAAEDRADGWEQLYNAIFKANHANKDSVAVNRIVIADTTQETGTDANSFVRTGRFKITNPATNFPSFSDQVGYTRYEGVLDVFASVDGDDSQSHVIQVLTITKYINSTYQMPERRVYRREYQKINSVHGWSAWDLDSDGKARLIKRSTNIDLDHFILPGTWHINTWHGSFVTPPSVTGNVIILRNTQHASDGVIQEIIGSLKTTVYDEAAYNDLWQRAIISRNEYAIGQYAYSASPWCKKITSENYQSQLSITTAMLANGAVTSAKLAAGAVGTAALGNSAVTSAKIAWGGVSLINLEDAAFGQAYTKRVDSRLANREYEDSLELTVAPPTGSYVLYDISFSCSANTSAGDYGHVSITLRDEDGNNLVAPVYDGVWEHNGDSGTAGNVQGQISFRRFFVSPSRNPLQKIRVKMNNERGTVYLTNMVISAIALPIAVVDSGFPGYNR